MFCLTMDHQRSLLTIWYPVVVVFYVYCVLHTLYTPFLSVQPTDALPKSDCTSQWKTMAKTRYFFDEMIFRTRPTRRVGFL